MTDRTLSHDDINRDLDTLDQLDAPAAAPGASEPDKEAERVNRHLDILDRVDAKEANAPGMWTSAKAALGQTADAWGRAAQDLPVIGGLNAWNNLRLWGKEAQDKNPMAIQSTQDVLESPWQTAKEGAGNAIGQMPAMAGGGGLGRVIGGLIGARLDGVPGMEAGQKIGAWIGSGLPVFGQEYGGIRAQQDEEVAHGHPEADDPTRAALAALPATAIEFGLGPQRLVTRAIGEGFEGSARDLAAQLAKETAGMDAKAASRHVLKTAAANIGRQGVEEGAEELVQNPLEAWGAHQDPLGPESIDQALTGAALGFAGGAALGAPMVGYQHARAKSLVDSGEVTAPAEETPPAAEVPPAPPLVPPASAPELAPAGGPLPEAAPGPLTRAAEAGRGQLPPEPAPVVDPLAGRLDAVRPLVENRDLMAALRRDPRFGPEALSDGLHAWAVAQNPAFDSLVRERALKHVEQLFAVPPAPAAATPEPALPNGDGIRREPAPEYPPAEALSTQGGLLEAALGAEPPNAEPAPALASLDDLGLTAPAAPAIAPSDPAAPKNDYPSLRARVEQGFTSLIGASLVNPKTGESVALTTPGERLAAAQAIRTALDAAAHTAATSPQNELPEPTAAQAAAGNYQKGHTTWNGLDLAIENPKGSVRKGVDPDGQPWQVTMPAHYGYVKRTTGADGDQVDVYLGNFPGADKVFVVDQIDPKTGAFDEHKAIGNVRSEAEAKALYDAGFSDGKGAQRRGAITPMTIEQFRQWVKTGDTTRPLAYQPRPGAAAAPAPAPGASGVEAAHPMHNRETALAKVPDALKARVQALFDAYDGMGKPDHAAIIAASLNSRKEGAAPLTEHNVAFWEQGLNKTRAMSAAQAGTAQPIAAKTYAPGEFDTDLPGSRPKQLHLLPQPIQDRVAEILNREAAFLASRGVTWRDVDVRFPPDLQDAKRRLLDAANFADALAEKRIAVARGYQRATPENLEHSEALASDALGINTRDFPGVTDPREAEKPEAIQMDWADDQVTEPNAKLLGKAIAHEYRDEVAAEALHLDGHAGKWRVKAKGGTLTLSRGGRKFSYDVNALYDAVDAQRAAHQAAAGQKADADLTEDDLGAMFDDVAKEKGLAPEAPVAPPAPEGKPGKPRLAENADDLWNQTVTLTDKGVVVPGHGIVYPAVHPVGSPDYYRLSSRGVEKMGAAGGVGTVRPPTRKELDELHADFDRDGVEVVALSHWGYSGNRDGSPKRLQVLHSPSGNGFQKGGDALPKSPKSPEHGENRNPVAAWDFMSTFPQVLESAKKGLDENGRSYPEDDVQNTAHHQELLHELIGLRSDIVAAEEAHRKGVSPLTGKPLGKEQLDRLGHSLMMDKSHYADSLGEYQNLYGREATDALDAHIRRQVEGEEPKRGPTRYLAEYAQYAEQAKTDREGALQQAVAAHQAGTSTPHPAKAGSTAALDFLVDHKEDHRLAADEAGKEALPDDAIVDTPLSPEALADVFRQVKNESERDALAFPEPEKTVKLAEKAKAEGFMPLTEAQARVKEWKAHALAQGKSRVNAGKVVVSLFDASGVWSQPWVDAGYDVLQFDLQHGHDIKDFDAETLTAGYDLADVHVLLAAPPCDHLANVGRQHWPAKDADGRTEHAKELVLQALRTVELFRPPIWALENPIGRIEEVAGLPKPTLAFQPHFFGDPWTKYTYLWGSFETDLPLANVEPTQGDKTSRLSSNAKYERSLTPEGFAYAFFMANNLHDLGLPKALAREFRGIPKYVFQKAVDAGLSESDIKSAISDSYYDFDTEQAIADLEAAVAEKAAPEEGGLQATARRIALEAAQIARREHPASADPRVDNILARETYLQDYARQKHDEALKVATEWRDHPERYSDVAGVSPEKIRSYASIIERQLALENSRVLAEAKPAAPPSAPSAAPHSLDESRDALLAQFPVGTRVKIKPYATVSGAQNWSGRTGTVARGHWDGWYVKLDPTPRERTEKTELILQHKGGTLERLEEKPAGAHTRENTRFVALGAQGARTALPITDFKDVTFAALPGVEFFVHPSIDADGYTVTERRTGLSLAVDKTAPEAIDQARGTIERLGADKVRAKIATFEPLQSGQMDDALGALNGQAVPGQGVPQRNRYLAVGYLRDLRSRHGVTGPEGVTARDRDYLNMYPVRVQDGRISVGQNAPWFDIATLWGQMDRPSKAGHAPNENGIYVGAPDQEAEVYPKSTALVKVGIKLLPLQDGTWLSTYDYWLNNGGSSSGLSADRIYPTRAAAVADRAQQVLDHILPAALGQTHDSSKTHQDNAQKVARWLLSLGARLPGNVVQDARGKLMVKAAAPAAPAPLVFVSGLSRPADFMTALTADKPAGIEIGELSDPGLVQLGAHLGTEGGTVFVDSGAFSVFMANLADAQAKGRHKDYDTFTLGGQTLSGNNLNFDAIFRRYEKLVGAVQQAAEDAGDDDFEDPAGVRLYLVMPDRVGDQSGSLALIADYQKVIQAWLGMNSVKPIVPLQKGEVSLTQAYDAVRKLLGDDVIVGIPSNEEAVANADLETFLKERGGQLPGIHILGAAGKTNLDPKILLVQKFAPNLPITADASPSWYGPRAEALKKALERAGERTPAIATPGTNLTWKDLAGWLQAWTTLAQRKVSSGRYAQQKAHWAALAAHAGRIIDGATDIAALSNFVDLARHEKAAGDPNAGTEARADLAMRAHNQRRRLEQAAGTWTPEKEAGFVYPTGEVHPPFARKPAYEQTKRQWEVLRIAASGVQAAPIQWQNVYGRPQDLPTPGDPERYGLKAPPHADSSTRIMLGDGTIWQYRGISAYGADNTGRVNGWENVTASVLDIAGHRDAIRQAIEAGKTVPPEVLASYPDLQALAAARPAAQSEDDEPGESAQYHRYRLFIGTGQLSPGLREQIHLDERLKDGESQALLDQFDAEAARQQTLKDLGRGPGEQAKSQYATPEAREAALAALPKRIDAGEFDYLYPDFEAFKAAFPQKWSHDWAHAMVGRSESGSVRIHDPLWAAGIEDHRLAEQLARRFAERYRQEHPDRAADQQAAAEARQNHVDANRARLRDAATRARAEGLLNLARALDDALMAGGPMSGFTFPPAKMTLVLNNLERYFEQARANPAKEFRFAEMKPKSAAQKALEEKAKAEHQKAVEKQKGLIPKDLFTQALTAPDLLAAAAAAPDAAAFAGAASPLASFLSAIEAQAEKDQNAARAEAARSLLVDGQPVLPETFFQSLYAAAKKAAAEAAKAAARDPQVYRDQLAAGRQEKGIEEGSASAARFQVGFDHALKGKTKSTLPQDDAAYVDGYLFAQKWLKTPEGRAWFEGKRGEKQESTGEALRRTQDRLRKDLSNLPAGDLKAAWDRLLKSTARADWFVNPVAEGATPGAQAWMEQFRSKVATFSEYFMRVAGGSHLSRGTRYFSAEDLFKGSYIPHRGTFAQHFDTVDQRLAAAREMAFAYQEAMARLSAEFTGVKNLAQIREVLDRLFGPVPEGKGLSDSAENSAFWKEFSAVFVDHAGDIKGLFPPAPTAWDAKYARWTRLEKSENEARPETDKKDALIRPRLDRILRQGLPDSRQGRDISPQELKAAFNFADVTVGEWVTAQEAQDHLNYVYDAFMDLAGLLKAQPTQLSFGGKLHFSIGALGHGKFAAHFDPNHPHPSGGTVPVINVTKTRGDGSVLHEFFHAIDFLTEDQALKRAIQSVKSLLEATPPEPGEAVKIAERFLAGDSKFTHMGRGATARDHARYALEQYYTSSAKSDRKTDFYREAEKLDGGTKDPYWSNDFEPFARMAEAWGFDALQGMGARSDYLQSDWVADGKVKAPQYRGAPYPMAAERARLTALFQDLVEAMEWTDAGPRLKADHPWRVQMPYAAKRAPYVKALSEAAAQLDLIEANLKAREAEAKARKEAQKDAALWGGDIAPAEEAPETAPETAPTESTDPGTDDLSEDELGAIFDEVAAQREESRQEKPEAEAPGAALQTPPEGLTREDLVFLRTQLSDGKVILLSGAPGPRYGLPTIHAMPSAQTKHMGYGVFETITPEYTANWTAGGAMSHTPGGVAYTTVHVEKGTFPYDRAGILQAIDAALAPPAAPTPAAPAPASLTAAQEKTAAELAREMAKHGVTGIDEALKGLVALFGGGKGKLASFPGGFDDEAYARAKPHFEAAAQAFRKAGMSFKEFVRVFFGAMIDALGVGVKPLAVRFVHEYKDTYAATEPAAPAEASAPEPKAYYGKDSPLKLAEWVKNELDDGETITWQRLFEHADQVYGGTQANGVYSVKDAYDAMELGINQYLLSGGTSYTPAAGLSEAKRILATLQDLLKQVPTQTKRTREMEEFQQFSTPPHLAFLANWVANLKPGDHYVEPSAGIGGLAIFARMAGVKSITVNELSKRRQDLLSALAFDTVFGENAEQLHNILPGDVRPTVIVMNPPFTATAGRIPGQRSNENGARHLEQALKRLVPGGRLVAIVGEGLAFDRPTMAAWWQKIRAEYNVRANVGLDGASYAKYGTTFNNQLVVIDKDGPTVGEPVTGAGLSPKEALALLENVRVSRPVPTEGSAATEPDRAMAGEPGSGTPPLPPGNPGRGPDAGTPGASVSPPVGAGSGPGQFTGASDVAAPAPAPHGGTPGSGAHAAPAGGRSADRSAGGAPAGANAGASGPGDSGPGAVTLSAPAPVPPAGELGNSVFEPYVPKKVRIPGAVPHNTPLVESAALASVEPPDAFYTPNLPEAVVKKGLLSDAQLESVVYAGQAHGQTLRDGATRRGFFLGDGTGVGKGRQISGIILDNWRQGRKKAVWISKKKELIEDAKRDFGDIGGNPALLFPLSRYSTSDAIKPTEGILFAGYPVLRSVSVLAGTSFKKGDPVHLGNPLGPNDGQAKLVSIDASKYSVTVEKGGRKYAVPFAQVVAIAGNQAWEKQIKAMDKAVSYPRIQQMVDWLGKDFDGVIVFDEAHEMGNAVAIKGERGTSQPSQQAIAALQLQKALPKARVVYVSATGATEVSNLAYAERLGLWGDGTPFSDVMKFVAALGRDVSSMELVAQNLKQMGLYLARSLSYEGVQYAKLEHALSPYQRETYDLLAGAWQTVLQNIDAALQMTGVMKDDGTAAGGRDSGKIKGAILSAFWGTHQRFFNQVITAAQMPAVLTQMEADLKAGHALVLQLTNTNEADQNRALAKLAGQKAAEGEDEDLYEELDLTPREQLIQLLEKAFPILQYESYLPEGATVPELRPVLDSQKKPVVNPEAVALREQLVAHIRGIRIPDTALQMVINHFGPDQVAEITGRTQRLIPGPDGKMKLEKRSSAAVAGDATAFKDDKKRILIFSQAGGTGFSFHADKRYKNHRQRVHYVLQPGWSADKAVQGFGRSHRTNQDSPPIYRLVTTDIPAQKRFISSIARRLEQLGALTAGQRDTAGGSMFSAADNLESRYARAAVDQFFRAVVQRGVTVPGIPGDLLAQMGLEGLIDPQTGGINDSKMPTVTQFLNRLLSLRLDTQGVVFQTFMNQVEAQLNTARRLGTFDDGLQTIRHQGATVKQEDVVYTDELTKAPTRYVAIDYLTPTPFYRFEDAVGTLARAEKAAWFKNKRSGRIAGVWTTSMTHTTKEGVIEPLYGYWRTSGTSYEGQSEFKTEAWEKVEAGAARALWEAENAARPAHQTHHLHLVVGGILPLWDRFDEHVQVARIQTDDGRRFLGRTIAPHKLNDTLKKLNVESATSKLTAAELLSLVLAGAEVKFTNGMGLKKVKVAHQDRIEFVQGNRWLDWQQAQRLQGLGLISETINYHQRYFFPVANPAPLAEAMKLLGMSAAEVISPDDGVVNPALRRDTLKRYEPDAQTARPLSPEEEAFAERRLARARSALGRGARGRVPAVEVVGVVDQGLDRVAGFVEKHFHRGTVFYRSTDPAAHNGFYLPRQPDVVFINVDGGDPVMQLAGHELLHALRHADEANYQRLVEAVRGLLRDPEGFGADLAAAYQRLGRTPPSAEAQEEELMAELAGRFFLDEPFWNAVTGQVPVERRRSFREWLQAGLRWLADRLGFTALGRHLTDVAQAREAFAQAFREFSQATTLPAASLAEVKPNLLADGAYPTAEPPALLDPARLAALRATAARLERPKDGVFLAVTPDGRAVATGPKGVKIPEGFRRFAAANGLDFTAQRGRGAGQTEPMPPAYRESGAAYFGEMAPVEDRTGEVRFAVPLTARPTPAAQLRDKILAAFQWAAKTSKTFNWWHRSFGTQYHKAQVDRIEKDGKVIAAPGDLGTFGRVYALAQQFLDDTSRFANEAADAGRDLLPRPSGPGEALAGMLNVRKDEKDARAIAGPVFQGTLRDRIFTAEELKAPPADELGKPMFAPLTDEQAGLYFQFRAAVDKSLDILGLSEMARLAKTAKLTPAPAKASLTEAEAWYRDQYGAALEAARQEAAEVDTRQAGELALLERAALDEASSAEQRSRYADLREAMKARHREERDTVNARLQDLAQLEAGIEGRAATIRKLQAEGYAPLMRFGRYTVDVTYQDENGRVIHTPDGKPLRVFFGMFETEIEAKRAADALRVEYPDAVVEEGIAAEKEFQLFRGITPETLEIFARMMGESQDEAFQSYLKLATNNRSALRRLIHRLGVEGFSQDPTRVLATFITSNARTAAGNYHFGDMLKAVTAIPQEKGDVKDEAIELLSYLQNPREEAPWARSLLFANYLGGSAAAALVNLTQTFTTTYPYLHQFGGQAGANLVHAMKLAASRMGKHKARMADPALEAALKRAEEEGVVAPHEIHMLQGESTRSGVLSGNRFWRNLAKVWGSFFSYAEQFNREVAFIAAYKVAQAKRLDSDAAYAFARKAVNETQFVYSKAARPNWARGPVKATLFTFRTFMVSYLEFLVRLPKKERLLALGVLMAAAGAQGLPFADDLDDLLDTIMQTLGFAWNTKQEKRAALASIFGDGAAGFLMHGASYGLPLDVQARLGAGNILPGTAVFKRSETDKMRDVVEWLGASGAFVKAGMGAFSQIQEAPFDLERDVKALAPLAPKALADIAKGLEMAQLGFYTDSRGRRVIDTDGIDAAIKMSGFQPTPVAQASLARGIAQEQINLVKEVQKDIHERWAAGLFEKDPDKVAEAQADLARWNEQNPEARVIISPATLLKRVRQMGLSANQRLVFTAPKTLRREIFEELGGGL